MNPERWRQAQRLMDAALDLEPGQRSQFLEERCADVDLRREVESLIVAAESDFTALDRPPLSMAVGEKTASAGDRVGPYRLIRPVGQGGMGTVYLAERADDVYHKQVAIKVLRDGLLTNEIVRRFRSEREILANLEHPNIARLLDGGATQDGRPFLVMEFVDGTPIDQYCDEHDLDLPQRLELFRRVCEAVHFAHRNLVVHRDLKPGNILVTKEGVPKLLDFGIAKLLNTKNFPQTVVATQPGFTPMTPAYASPEQVRAGPITTSSDVYSLGVLLYKLLAGQWPYDLTGRSAAQIEKIVCEQAPPFPSSLVGARDRRWSRQLEGDLDNIVSMALRKEPQRRYSSAEQLASDLDRFLAGLPVIAHKDTLAYRIHKFVLRHRVSVVSSMVVLLALVGMIILLLIQQKEILGEWNRAEVASEFLVDMFEGSDPLETTNRNLSARDLLDRGTQVIDDRLAGQPEIRGDLLLTMGRSYLSLGEFDPAERLLRAALEIRRQQFQGDHVEVMEALRLVAQLDMEMGRFESSEEGFLQSLEMGRRLFDRPHEQMVENLYRLARLLDLRGRYREADPYYREAASVASKLSTEDSLARVYTNHGLLLARMAQYSEAERVLQEALRIQRQNLGEDHPWTALALNNYAFLLTTRGDLQAAENLLKTIAESQREAFGDHHPSLALTIGLQGRIAHEQARLDEAESYLRQAEEIFAAAFKEPHPRRAIHLSLLAQTLAESGKGDEAEPMARQALAMSRGILGDNHPETAQCYFGLGLVLTRQGNMQEAEESYQRALQICREAYGDNHPRTGAVLMNLGTLAMRRRDLDAATELYSQALDILPTFLGEDHFQIGQVSNNLAFLLHSRKEYAAAEQRYLKGIGIMQRELGDDHPQVAMILNNLARLKIDLDQPMEAEPLARQAKGILERELPAGHRALHAADRVLGRSLTAQGRFAEAEAVLKPRFDLAHKELGLEAQDTRLVYQLLLKLYDAWGRQEQAADLRALQRES